MTITIGDLLHSSTAVVAMADFWSEATGNPLEEQTWRGKCFEYLNTALLGVGSIVSISDDLASEENDARRLLRIFFVTAGIVGVVVERFSSSTTIRRSFSRVVLQNGPLVSLTLSKHVSLKSIGGLTLIFKEAFRAWLPRNREEINRDREIDHIV